MSITSSVLWHFAILDVNAFWIIAICALRNEAMKFVLKCLRIGWYWLMRSASRVKLDFSKETSGDLDLPLNIRIPQDCSQEWVTLIRKSLKKGRIFSMQMRMTISFCSLTTQDTLKLYLRKGYQTFYWSRGCQTKLPWTRHRKGYKRHI